VSLFWRVAALNAVAFAIGGVLLALTPATVSTPVAESEIVILAGGFVALLALNVLILRWGFAPFDHLVEQMRSVDTTRPGRRLEESGPPETRVVIAAFNGMLERLEQERRGSARAAVTAQEAERARVARELHDEIGQGLTAVLIALSRAADRAPAESRDELVRALEVARGSLDDVRRVARRLRPDSLDDLGLPSALMTLCRRFEEQAGGMALERHVDLDLPRLPAERELVVFRVAQESLTNVARHSGATRACLRVERADGDGVVLSVQDDGRGIDGRGRDGSGIEGMRERALLVEADLVIEDRREGGLEVRLQVPGTAPAEA
jgi:two-component system, NarL family, sensor histidine kinase UhpB